MALRPDPDSSVQLSSPATIRKYEHVEAHPSWKYNGPEIQLRAYASGHWFLYVGDSLFTVSRLEALQALRTKEWRRANA